MEYFDVISPRSRSSLQARTKIVYRQMPFIVGEFLSAAQTTSFGGNVHGGFASLGHQDS
jgi:hypothetical protein